MKKIFLLGLAIAAATLTAFGAAGDVILKQVNPSNTALADRALVLPSPLANRIYGLAGSTAQPTQYAIGSGFGVSGTAPNLTLTAIGSGGTMTSISVGNLSPIFTAGVTDPTGAASITFTLSSAAQNAVLAGPISGSGSPAYRSLVAADLPSISSGLSGILPSGNGGTGNGFTKFSGPTTTEKTFTLPNASALILTDNAAVTVAQGGTGASTLTGLLQGNGTGAFTAISNSSTVGQVLRVTGSSTYAWGALDLADADAITGALPSASGGTGSAFFAVSGPTTSVKIFTFPNASSTVFTSASTNPYTALPFTLASGTLLGRTSILPGTVEEITPGSSLSFSSGALNTIQDIRTSATPQFTRLGLGAAADATAGINIQKGTISAETQLVKLGWTDDNTSGVVNAGISAYEDTFGSGGFTGVRFNASTSFGDAVPYQFYDSANPDFSVGINPAIGAIYFNNPFNGIVLRRTNSTKLTIYSDAIDFKSQSTLSLWGAITSTGFQGAIGATTPSTGAFTTLTTSANATINNTGASAILTIKRTDGGATGEIRSRGDQMHIGTSDNFPINFYVNGSQMAAFTSTGINGTAIGATTPAAGSFSTLATASSTPASASATGVANTITWDSSFIYICVATNTWKRVAIATW